MIIKKFTVYLKDNTSFSAQGQVVRSIGVVCILHNAVLPIDLMTTISYEENK